VAFDGQPVTDIETLQSYLAEAEPGQEGRDGCLQDAWTSVVRRFDRGVGAFQAVE